MADRFAASLERAAGGPPRVLEWAIVYRASGPGIRGVVVLRKALPMGATSLGYAPSLYSGACRHAAGSSRFFPHAVAHESSDQRLCMESPV